VGPGVGPGWVLARAFGIQLAVAPGCLHGAASAFIHTPLGTQCISAHWHPLHRPSAHHLLIGWLWWRLRYSSDPPLISPALPCRHLVSRRSSRCAACTCLRSSFICCVRSHLSRCRRLHPNRYSSDTELPFCLIRLWIPAFASSDLRPPIAFLLARSPFPLVPHFRHQHSLFADRRGNMSKTR
jgi:hypothetical protein